MNIHKVLLGAILIKPDLAPYSLPDLEIEHFPVAFNRCLLRCPAFGMQRVSWTRWKPVPDTLSSERPSWSA